LVVQEIERVCLHLEKILDQADLYVVSLYSFHYTGLDSTLSTCFLNVAHRYCV
jgi:hypothetical protein